ncbi:MAG: hypothetical protein QW478_08400 [Candidatus Micrarchaeaceae archaeon]
MSEETEKKLMEENKALEQYIAKLREEIERLKEENRILKKGLNDSMRKDIAKMYAENFDSSALKEYARIHEIPYVLIKREIKYIPQEYREKHKANISHKRGLDDHAVRTMIFYSKWKTGFKDWSEEKKRAFKDRYGDILERNLTVSDDFYEAFTDYEEFEKEYNGE